MVQAIDLLTQKASLNVHSTRFAPLTPDRIFPTPIWAANAPIGLSLPY